jgi:hypothetical protein
VRVVRGDPVGELVEVRLPDDGVPGLLEPRDRGGGLRGYVVAKDGGSVGRYQPRCVEEVLDAEADALAGRVGPGQEGVEIVSRS